MNELQYDVKRLREFADSSKQARELQDSVLARLCNIAVEEGRRINPDAMVASSWCDPSGTNHVVTHGGGGRWLFHEGGGQEEWADVYVEAYCTCQDLAAHVQIAANGTSFMGLARDIAERMSREGVETHVTLQDWYQRRDDDWDAKLLLRAHPTRGELDF